MTDEQSRLLDTLFKFKIGDVVRHVVGDPDHQRQWTNSTPMLRMMVVEQHLIRCYGGTQAHYTCRNVASDGGFTRTLDDLNEIELVASAPFRHEMDAPT
jgi:hypothetical protein